MKAPICGICLKSDVLCKACDDKLRRGEVSDLEVRLSRELSKLSEKIKPVRDISIKKVVETDKLLIIVCEEGDASKMIGRSGIVAKRLGRELGRQVKIVEDAGSEKEFISKLLHPAKLTGTSILYTPDREVLKVRTDSSPPISPKDFRQIMKLLFGKDMEI